MMDARGFHNLTRDFDDFIDEAFCGVVRCGYPYAVLYDGNEIHTVIRRLVAARIEYRDSLGVFGFRTKCEAEAFSRQFCSARA